MVGGPYTLVVWSRSHGGDFLSAVAAAQSKERIDVSDYLAFAWAMCAAADGDTPPFEEWCAEGWPDFDLGKQGAGDVASVISSAIVAEFFPGSQARGGALRRARRRLGAALGRLRRPPRRHGA